MTWTERWDERIRGTSMKVGWGEALWIAIMCRALWVVGCGSWVVGGGGLWAVGRWPLA